MIGAGSVIANRKNFTSCTIAPGRLGAAVTLVGDMFGNLVGKS